MLQHRTILLLIRIHSVQVTAALKLRQSRAEASTGTHNEEADVVAQESSGQQLLSDRPPISTHARTISSRRQTRRLLRGNLIPEYGGKRYYGHGFIGIMGQEYRQSLPNPSTNQESTNSGPVVTSTEATADLLAASALTKQSSSFASVHVTTPEHQLCLSTADRMKYWSIFVENVHPLTNVVHAQPLRHSIIHQGPSGTCDTTSSTKDDALLYAVCACVVFSLEAMECERVFNSNQSQLLETLQSAASQCLFNASFLKVPDLDLLRAHVLLLTSMLHNSETYLLWTLMGTTIRLAQSQGLHRDGLHLGLSVFETEMRRRLWWCIVALDARVTEIIGGESSLPKSRDVSLPSNLNDEELSPSMTCYPNFHTGASDMTFCLIRYEIARFLLERGDSRHDQISTSPQAPHRKMHGLEHDSISELESFLEQKYLRFCDPVVPLQLLATTTARPTICKLKQMAIHSISQFTPEDGHVVQHQVDAEDNRRKTFSLALRNNKYDNLTHSNKSQSRYFWFVNFHIPWGGPVYVLKALAYYPDWDSGMEAAWEQIEALYGHHPEYLDHDKDIYYIIRGLTLRAWSSRERVLKAKGLTGSSDAQVPTFIKAIKARLSENGDLSPNDSDGETQLHRATPNPASLTNDLGSGSSVDIERLDPLFASGEWVDWFSS